MRKEQKYPLWAKAERVRNAQAGIDRSERQRKEYLEQKNAYNNSPEGRYTRSVMDVVQKCSKAEEEAYAKMFEAIASLRVDSVELIKQKVALEKDIYDYLGYKTIKEVIKSTDLAINKIKQTCELSAYKQRLRKTSYSEYEKLFNSLIDEVDAGFAIYAPLRSLARKNIKFNKLPDSVKDLVFDRMAELGLTENEEFVEHYYEVFKNQIENASIIADGQ